MLAEAVVVGVNICCADDAHMIGMCDIAQVVRNNKHSLPVVASCVKRFRGCIGILPVVEFGSVVLVEVNGYLALPRTANAVAVTSFHVVRDARVGGMPRAADKRPDVAVHGKIMKSIVNRLPSADNVILHPGHSKTRHPWLSGMAWIVLPGS
jgi:hypothetical protein